MAFSIIIPSRSAANLVPCVRAIREAGETARIIVVDDGVDWGLADDDGEPSWEPCNYVDGAKPFVFAGNVNIGILAAGDDDVILLNDDALLKTPNGFTWMMREQAHAASRQYGLIAAACNTVGNQNQFRQSESGLRDEPRMACFVCVYIPRSTINAVGLLDERFIHYGMDDDDYSLRVRNAGLSIGIFDGCFVDHGSLTSSYRGGPQVGGDFRPNMKIFIEKWGVDNRGLGRDESPYRELFPQ